MTNTIVLHAEQQTTFRAYNIARDDHDTIDHVQSWQALNSKSQDDAKKVTVTIPDMFVLFLSEPPRVNPNYARVKAESEDWFAEYTSSAAL